MLQTGQMFDSWPFHFSTFSMYWQDNLQMMLPEGSHGPSSCDLKAELWVLWGPGKTV